MADSLAADLVQIGQLNVSLSLHPAGRAIFATPTGPIMRQVIRAVLVAKRAGLPVSLVEIKAASDPEIDGWRQAVVRVTDVQAWHGAAGRGGALDRAGSGPRWTGPFQRKIMDETVGLQVVWPEG